MTATMELAQRQQTSLAAPVGNQATLKGLLEASRHQIAEVLPEHVTPERIIKVALVAAVQNPALLRCSRESVLQSVMQAATLGLDPGGALGAAYLVPYGNKCTLIPGFRGLIDLARRSGEIVSINAEVVYQQDKFSYHKGTSPKLEHEPDVFAELNDDDIIGAYMVAHFKGGGMHIEFMNRQQIEKVRRSSKSGGAGPWRDHYPEMCRKTVIRRGFKYLPVSSERLVAVIEHDNRVDGSVDGHGADHGMASVTERLNAGLTRRPTSEGQRYEPDPDADRNVAAQEAEDGEIINRDTGEIDASGAEAEPPLDGTLAPPDVSSWPRALNSAESAAQDAGLAPGEFAKRVGAWLVALKLKTTPEKTTPEQRATLVQAIRDGRLTEDGKIVPAKG